MGVWPEMPIAYVARGSKCLCKRSHPPGEICLYNAVNQSVKSCIVLCYKPNNQSIISESDSNEDAVGILCYGTIFQWNSWSFFLLLTNNLPVIIFTPLKYFLCSKIIRSDILGGTDSRVSMQFLKKVMWKIKITSWDWDLFY